ncbi:hypothetical protein EDD29_6798 [Actinocorallia herbida]|uniref:Uncharacterized protein n=1 Tax=Actinocorallia herbida TaxID=58109 RepID=A0A3N1D6E6_9ACTN|nr:hypothetical protein [Actinocorallia herbida]ROO89111.1 hypothetical protein EDD29_6798 [Actinocorallia herbida]
MSTSTCSDHVPARTLLGRTGATLTVACAAAHLPLLFGDIVPDLPRVLVMVVVTAACLTCAPVLWRSPSPHCWTKTAFLAAAMLTLHLGPHTATSGSVVPSAAHPHSTSVLPSLPMSALTGLSLAQLALGLTALALIPLRRRRAPSLASRSPYAPPPLEPPQDPRDPAGEPCRGGLDVGQGLEGQAVVAWSTASERARVRRGVISW